MKIIEKAGFTLIELLLAVTIFAAVIGGLAVIYSTAFRQSLAMINEASLKQMGALSMKAMQREITSATRIDTPAADAGGQHLRGMANFAPDNTIIDGGAAATVTWFHFCVSNRAVGGCGTGGNQPWCLWYYSGNGTALPAINNGNCGNAAGGVTPILLASNIMSQAPICTPCTRFFTRRSAGPDNVPAQNQIRANFRMQRAASASAPMMRHTVDSAFNAHFAP
jgi:prepilin-type N-terminal cleavage/methylation domain-containing protein